MMPTDISPAQMKLHQTRNELQVLLVKAQNNEHFPRSATMKWLLSTSGQRVVGYVAGGSISRLVPGVGALLRTLPLGMLIKKFWPRKTHKTILRR